MEKRERKSGRDRKRGREIKREIESNIDSERERDQKESGGDRTDKPQGIREKGKTEEKGRC